MNTRDVSATVVVTLMALSSAFGAGCASSTTPTAASAAAAVPLGDALLARVCDTDPTGCAAASREPAAPVAHPPNRPRAASGSALAAR